MKCLTIRQPFAAAVLLGAKAVEYRTRPTRHRGPLLVHAALDRRHLDGATAAGWAARGLAGLPPLGGLPLGAFAGVVRVLGCRPEPGRPGVWAWSLGDPRPFPRPVAARGRLGLWDFDPAALPPDARAVVESLGP